MWPFSKKWSAPDPQLAMVISLAKPELPSLIMLANPSGEEGAVAGMAGPADEKPSAENMMTPLKEGNYVAISATHGGCSLNVERHDPKSEGLSLPPEMLEPSGLTQEMLDKFNRPVWRAILRMEAPGENVQGTVVFATRVAQRLASLADGVIMDTAGYRFFGPAGWPVENPISEFDAREHVHIHFEGESAWFHTHGLVKFGRPELEIYEVPPELNEAAYAMLLDVCQYVITTSLISPGQTCGDPEQPFYAREGKKNDAGHWNGVSVLELVDLDDRKKPIAAGAPKALQHFASS